MKLRYSEAFYSVQGEGAYVGVPSVFLRTFGCNLRCMGFGLPRGTANRKELQEQGIKHNPEVAELIATDGGDILNRATTFEDLPVIHTGCDTYASIYPEFKNYMMNKDVDEVVEHLLSLTPEGRWTQEDGQDVHLIITGGEPLLGWQKMYIELFNHPRMKDLKNVTFETNTTQKLHPDLLEYFGSQERIRFTFSCSPKLSVSGETWDDAIKPEIAASYASVPNSDMYFKFVVADRTDIEDANRAFEAYRKAGVNVPVYLMPLGGRSEEYDLNVTEVAEVCMEKGWRFSPRLHISLFGNAWGT